MTKNERVCHICDIHRALGIVEGVASGLENCAAVVQLNSAVELIDEAMEVLFCDDDQQAAD